MSQNERQQRVVERILEDERLRGDLEDTAATALINWASARAEAAAADPARPDDAVEAEVQAVRMAARSAARSAESDPQRLIALAEAALKQNDSAEVGKATEVGAATEHPPAATGAAAAAGKQSAAPKPAAASTGSSRAATPPATPIAASTRPSRQRWQRFVGWFRGKRQE